MSSEPYGLCMIQLSLSLLFGKRNYIEITGVSCQIKRMYNSSLFLKLGFPVMHFTRVQIDPDSGSQGTMVRLARKMFCMDFNSDSESVLTQKPCYTNPGYMAGALNSYIQRCCCSQ